MSDGCPGTPLPASTTGQDVFRAAERGKPVPARRWTINGRFLTQNVTGVQRYGRSILSALDALVDEGHPAARGLDLEVLMPHSRDKPEFRAIPVRQVGPFSGHLWEQVTLPIRARGPLLNLCNTGPVSVTKQIVCIHDVNTQLQPGSYSLAFRSLYRTLLPILGRSASTVATVSRFSADQLVRRGLTSGRTPLVIPNGHEHALSWDAPERQASTATPETIVILGSLAPHKNVGLIVGMADQLAAHGLRLAIVGHKDARIFGDGGCAASATDSVSWLGPLSDGDLSRLLRSSLCLAFPSIAEGFGLPPLEAMALGCPVVVSDRTSLPEVCGDAALFAAPDRPSEWLEAFLRLKNDAGLRAAMATKGRQRAKMFSWRRSAESYLDAMKAG